MAYVLSLVGHFIVVCFYNINIHNWCRPLTRRGEKLQSNY